MSSPAGSRPLASYLAGLAYLEAASVDAFEILRSELEAHGAPACLAHAASRAAGDEVRHARTMASLTRRYGGAVPRPRVRKPAAPRPVLALAMENAREGCIRETYGALSALWQAERATDPRIRAAFAAIARDEVRHAALAWRVAAWAEARLRPDERAAVASERARAANELLEELRTEPPPDAVHLAGVPTASAAIELAQGMSMRLWANTTDPLEDAGFQART